MQILIVEDNLMDLEVLKNILIASKENSYELLHAESLKNSLDILANNQIDILLLDLSLTDSYGLPTFHQIHSKFPNLPVIILAGSFDSAFASMAVKSGAQDYIQKSELSTKLLEKAIMYAIARKKSDDHLLLQNAILENVREIIIVIDIEGTITYWNQGAAIEFGYSSDEMIGQCFSVLVATPIDKADLIHKLAKMIEVDYDGEWVGKRKNKSLIHLEVVSKTMKNARGEIIGFVGVSRCIDEKKKMLQDLKKSENSLMALFNTAPNGIVLMDKDLQLLSFNPIAKKIAKKILNAELYEGLNCLDVCPLKWRESFNEIINNTLLQNKIFKVRQKVRDSDKNEIWFEVSFAPVVDQEQKQFGVSISLNDITQTIIDANKILQQNQELQKTNSELDNFVYSASHDLKVPLSAVLGIINVARIDTDSSIREVYLDMMEKNVRRLLGIIKDLTNFSRNSRLNLTYEKIDFKFLIDDIYNSIVYHENALEIDFSYHITKDVFYSDRIRLQILLTNLISNAIIFHDTKKESPFVKVTVNSLGQQIQILVEDNGKGIKNEIQDKVFDMFYRGSTNSLGSGLGLYIVKGIVEKLNGQVRLESEPWSGTTIKVLIPNHNLFLEQTNSNDPKQNRQTNPVN